MCLIRSRAAGKGNVVSRQVLDRLAKSEVWTESALPSPQVLSVANLPNINMVFFSQTTS